MGWGLRNAAPAAVVAGAERESEGKGKPESESQPEAGSRSLVWLWVLGILGVRIGVEKSVRSVWFGLWLPLHRQGERRGVWVVLR